MTTFFVSSIKSEGDTSRASGGKDINWVGFQGEESAFVSGWDENINVLAHELGHYLFGDLYTSLEGSAHTSDRRMLMYHVTGRNCEIRQNEWREVAASKK